MATLLIAWHSSTGASQALAAAAAEGACAAGADGGPPVQVMLRHAAEVMPDHLLAASGSLFCMPEMLGSMSGVMKDLFDRSYYPVLDRMAGRPCGLVVAAGSDGEGAVRQFERIARGLRWRLVAPPLVVCTRAQTPEDILAPKAVPPNDLQRAHDLGAMLAAGLSLGLW